MGLSPGFTVLIILPAFLLHTSGLYIASSVGTYSIQASVVTVYVVSTYIRQAGCTGALYALLSGSQRSYINTLLLCNVFVFFSWHAFAVFANNIVGLQLLCVLLGVFGPSAVLLSPIHSSRRG